MPATNFDLASLAGDIQKDVTNINNGVQSAVTPLAGLPLIGDGLQAANSFTNRLNTVLNELKGSQGIGQQSVNISPDSSVSVQATASNGTLDLTVTLDNQYDSAIDFKLGSFLKVVGSDDIKLDVTTTLDLHFSYQDSSGNATGLALENGNSISLQLGATFPGHFELTVAGLLDAYVTDNKLPNGDPSGVTGSITANFDANGNFGTPSFGAKANANLKFDLAFAHDANGQMRRDLPFNLHLTSDFLLTWELSDPTSGSGLYSGLTKLAFQDVTLDAGLTFPSFLKAYAQKVEQFIQPMMPFLSFLNKEVPVLNDFGVHETFLDLLNETHVLSQTENNAINELNDFDSLANQISAGSLQIKLGDLNLDTSGNVQNFAAGALTALGSIPGPDIPAIQDALSSLTIDAPGDENPEEMIPTLEKFGFQFPILDASPTNAVFQLLMGNKTEDLVTFKLQPLTADLDVTAGISIGFFGFGLEGSLHLAADLSAGYDATGLVDLAQTLLDPKADKSVGHLISVLSEGFYLDETPLDSSHGVTHYATGLDFTGSLSANATAVAVGASAAINADVSLHLRDAKNADPRQALEGDANDHNRVRLNNLISGLEHSPLRVFGLEGAVTANADIKIGLELGIINVTAYTYHLAQVDIVRFSNDAGDSDASTDNNDPTLIPVTFHSQPGATYNISIKPYEQRKDGNASLDDAGRAIPSDFEAYTLLDGIEVLYPDGTYNLYPTVSNLFQPDNGGGFVEVHQGFVGSAYHIEGSFPKEDDGSGAQKVVIETGIDVGDEYDKNGNLVGSTFNSQGSKETIWHYLDNVILNGGSGDDYFDVSQLTESANKSASATLFGNGGNDTLIGGIFEYGGPGSDTMIAPNGRNATLTAGNGGGGELDGRSYLQAGVGGSYLLKGGVGDDWFEVPLGLDTSTEVHGGQGFKTPGDLQSASGSDTLHIINAVEDQVPGEDDPPVLDTLTISKPDGTGFQISSSLLRSSGITADGISAIEVSEKGNQDGTVQLPDLSTLGLTSVTVNFDQATSVDNVQVEDDSADSRIYTLTGDGYGGAVLQDQGLLENSHSAYVYIRGMGQGDNLTINSVSDGNSYNFDWDNTWGFNAQVNNFSGTQSSGDDLTINAGSKGYASSRNNVTTLSVLEHLVSITPNLPDSADDLNLTIPPAIYPIGVVFADRIQSLTVNLPYGGGDVTVDQDSFLGVDLPASTVRPVDLTINGSDAGDQFTVLTESGDLTINGGKGDDVFTMMQNGQGSTHLFGGGGNDAFHLGGDVLDREIIDGQAGNDSYFVTVAFPSITNITVDDSGIGDANNLFVEDQNLDDPSNLFATINYTLRTQGLDRSSADGNNPDNVVFFFSTNVKSIILDAGSHYTNFVQVHNIPAGDAVTINAGSHADQVQVGDAQHSINQIFGALTVHGNTGTVLTVDDEDDTPTLAISIAGPELETTPVQTDYTMTANQLTRTTQITLDPPPPTPRQPLSWSVQYSGLAQLVIEDGPNLAKGYSYHLYSTVGTSQVMIQPKSNKDDVTTNDNVQNVIINGNGSTTLTVDERSLIAQETLDPLGNPALAIPSQASVTMELGGVSGSTDGIYIDLFQPGSFALHHDLDVAYLGLSSVTIQTSAAPQIATTVQVTGATTADAKSVTVYGNGLHDSVSLGDANHNLSAVTAPVTILGNNLTQLTIDDRGNVPTASYTPLETRYEIDARSGDELTRTETANDVSAPLPSSIMQVEYDNLASLTIDGGAYGHYDFQVNSTLATSRSIINTASIADNVIVGDSAYNVDDVPELHVNGDGSTFLYVRDLVSSNISVPVTDSETVNVSYDPPIFTVGSQQVSVAKKNGQYRINNSENPVPLPDIDSVVTYSGLASLSVTGGNGLNRFDVNSTAPSTPVDIHAGTGGDSVNIGNTADMVDDIHSIVRVYGAAGNTTLNVHDQGNTATADYELTTTRFTRTPFTWGLPEGRPTQTIDFFNVSAVNVHGGGGDARDLYGVASSLLGTTYSLYSGGGSDNEFFVSNGFDSLDDIQGPVVLHGDGFDLAFATDTLNTAGHTYNLDATTLSRTGMADITYDGMAEFVLAAGDNPYSSPSPDQINLEGSNKGTFTIVVAGEDDKVVVGQPVGKEEHSLSSLQGLVRVQSVASEAPSVEIDDSGDTTGTARQVNFDFVPSVGYEIDGLAPQPIVLQVGAGSPVSVTGDTAAKAFHLDALPPGLDLSIDGGAGNNSTLDTGVAGLAGNLDQTLTLTDVAVGALHVLGDISGQLLASTLGTIAAPIQSITVDGGVTSTGAIKVNYLGSLSVAKDVAGVVKGFGNSGDQNKPTIGSILVGGSVTSTGLITAPILVSPTIMGDEAGHLVEASPTQDMQNLHIGGSLTATGVVSAASIGSMSVGKDLAGQVRVQGLFGSLDVAGNLSGSVTAANLNSVMVGHALSGQIQVAGQLGPVTAGTITSLSSTNAHGPIVLDVNLGGIERTLIATPLPACSLDAVSFSYSINGSGPGNPALTVHVTNTDPVHDRFDLSLLSSSAAGGFDLAQLDSTSGAAGLHNLLVDGNLLAGAVQLPRDYLGSVAVWGSVASVSIYAGSIEALAFGAVANKHKITVAQNAKAEDASQILDPRTSLAQANGTIEVSVTSAQPVALFLDLGRLGRFAESDVLFGDQAQSNFPLSATITVSPESKHGDRSRLQTIALQGDGGSVDTRLPIDGSISSTGWLGDLTIESQHGLTADVTAPSIRGNIDVTRGGIAGTIQTTAGDIGQTYADASGKVHATTIHSAGDISGRIISRGDLISQVLADDGISGVIAAQGNIGAAAGATRLGGIVANGDISGEIVTLGNFIGNLVDHGNLAGGRIAVKGDSVGNIIIDGSFDASAALVAGGSMGQSGTAVQVGKVRGILAAGGNISLSSKANTSKAAFYGTKLKNTTDGAAIDAIFTDMGKALSFDNSGLGLQGLDMILAHLVALHSAKGHLTGTVA